MAKLIHPVQYFTIFGIIFNGLHFGSADIHPSKLVISVDPVMLNKTLEALAAGDFSKIFEIPKVNAHEMKSITQKLIDLQTQKLQREFDSICSNVTNFGHKFRATVKAAKKAGDQFLANFEDTTTTFMNAFDKSRSFYLKKAHIEAHMGLSKRDVDEAATDDSNDWLYGETPECNDCHWIDHEKCRSQIEEVIGERWADRFWNFWNTSCGECPSEEKAVECVKTFRKEVCETTDDDQLKEDCRVFPMGKLGGPLEEVRKEQVEFRSAVEPEEVEESNLYADLTAKYIQRVKEHLMVVRKVRKYSRRIFIVIERGIWHKSLAKKASLEEKFLFKLGGFGNVDHTPMYRLLLLRYIIKNGLHENLKVDKLGKD